MPAGNEAEPWEVSVLGRVAELRGGSSPEGLRRVETGMLGIGTTRAESREWGTLGAGEKQENNAC